MCAGAYRAMRRAQMTKHELEAALRGAGCAGPEEVRFAVLENNGQVTVIPHEHHPAVESKGTV